MSKKNVTKSSDEKIAISRLYVKYMVSLRCKIIAKSELDALELKYSLSPHGAIEFDEEITEGQYDQLKKNLMRSGLVLLSESNSMLIDKIITTIVEIIHYSDSLPKLNFRDLISSQTLSSNESILKIFSDVKGMSILQFIIIQKIERAKELMLYEDHSLSEIADILNYKNKDYLLAQFKKVTGLSPSYFKRLRNERLKISENRLHASESKSAQTSS